MKQRHYHITRLLGYLITLWSGIVFVVLIQSLQDRIQTSADLLLPLFAIITSLLVLTLGQLLLMYRKLLLSADNHYPPTTPPHEYQEAFTIRMNTWTLLGMSILICLLAIYIIFNQRISLNESRNYTLQASVTMIIFNALTFGLVGLGLSQLARLAWTLRKRLDIHHQIITSPVSDPTQTDLPLFTWLQINLMLGGLVTCLCSMPLVIVAMAISMSDKNLEGIIFIVLTLITFFAIMLIGQILHFTEQSYIMAKRIDTLEPTKITRKASFSGWASAFTLFYRLIVASCVIPLGIYFIVIFVIANTEIATIIISAIIGFIIACFIGIGQLLALTNRLQTHFDGQSLSA